MITRKNASFLMFMLLSDYGYYCTGINLIKPFSLFSNERKTELRIIYHKDTLITSFSSSPSLDLDVSKMKFKLYLE